jgi:hypothetical protein
MKLGRTDRLSPEEREIVDRFERGVIDAGEAGRLLIASVRRVEVVPPEPADPEIAGEDGIPGETPEEAAARELVERIAREAYDDPKG